MTIHEKEEQLFNEWKEAIACNNNFVPDGLLNKGEITYTDQCWGREPGNEEELWENIYPRVLFLTKDQNDKDKKDENAEAGWDIRKETGRKNGTGVNNIKIASRFYHNYMLWFYGLHHTTAEGYPPYNDIKDIDTTIRLFFDREPVVRMNVKKEVGGSSLSYGLLKYNLDKYKDFIVRQMALYDADIIVCCGGARLTCEHNEDNYNIGQLSKFVKDYYLPDFQKFRNSEDDWIYWSEKQHKVVIDSYHPSVRGLSYENMYTGLVKNYQSFLKEHPSFSHR